MANVSVDDLRLAAEWLAEYEGDQSETTRMNNVAAWLYAEAYKREKRSAVRQIVRKTGMTAQHARTVLSEHHP